MDGRKKKDCWDTGRKYKGRKVVEGRNEGNKNGLLLCWNDERKWKEIISTGRKKNIQEGRKERLLVWKE